MSHFRRTELIESYNYYPSFHRETSIFTPKILPFPSFFDNELEEFEPGYCLDLVKPSPRLSALELIDSVTDLIRIDQTPSFSSYKRIQRVDKLGGDAALQSLSARVSKLESRFDRLLKVSGSSDRKYTWTAEIKGPENHGIDRKYKLIAEVKEGKKKKKDATGKTYKWTTEFEGKGSDGPIKKTYTFKASAGDEGTCNESKKKDNNKKSNKPGNETRIVEIEESGDHRAVVLRQAFTKKAGASGSGKGKKKELSPQDAAMMIQMSFRAYLIRRSKVLRALRDLAIAKTKLKDIRASFNNFSYRRRLAHDAEERQRFSEKIIVLLLTVDGIEGADLMVRAAKRSMIDELEAMLHVVDPHPPEKSLSMKRRTFDMPDGIIQKEIAAGVAEVVQMLNHEENSANTFEACL